MVEFVGNVEGSDDEKEFLWNKCLALYKVISHNGTISAKVFRLSTQMAGGVFQGKVNMQHIVPWFGALAEFLEWMELAIKQKGITL